MKKSSVQVKHELIAEDLIGSVLKELYFLGGLILLHRLINKINLHSKKAKSIYFIY